MISYLVQQGRPTCVYKTLVGLFTITKSNKDELCSVMYVGSVINCWKLYWVSNELILFLWLSTSDYPFVSSSSYWFSISDYPLVSSCSSLVFDFRLPLCILQFLLGFRLPITPWYPPVLLWFSTSDYPFVSSCSSLVFDFRLPLFILLFFCGFRLPITLFYPPLLWFSTSNYPLVSSCSSLIFDFRLPICILLFFVDFRLPITPLHPPVFLWFSTSEYPFVSSKFPISLWFFFIISSDAVSSNPAQDEVYNIM